MGGKSVDSLTAAPPGFSASAAGDVGVTSTERTLVEVLVDIVSAEQVSVDDHFFDDLGADSMMMARFCARVRKCADLPSVSMKDIYRYPTVRSLAGSMGAAPTSDDSSVPVAVEAEEPGSSARYVVCGALQLLFFLLYCYLAGLVAALGYRWISAASGVVELYVRSVWFGGAFVLAVCILPVVGKWVLVGRWKPGKIRVWGLGYVRFWLVETLVRANPVVFLFVGTPLYMLYLKALGAKIGPGVAIFSRNVPVCTDLLTIGAGTVIRREAFFAGYRARAGRIETGAVTLGRGVLVGEKTVLDINTSMGDGAQLGHASALHAGQAVPEGERWHGSPAQPTAVDYLRVAPAGCGRPRRVVFGILTLLKVLLLYVPLVQGGLYVLVTAVPALVKLTGTGTTAIASRELYIDALVLSLVLFFGAAVVGLVLVGVVPRLLNLMIKPEKVYRLYGVHYSLYRTIARLTNRPFFTYLFGDSSYIVHYLRWLGYDLSQVVQTGANFGMEVAHETPYLCFVGSGTMIADGLSMINADFSNSSFRLSRASIGPRNFLGNHIAYPSGGRTGDNCLLATKVMVPLDGDVREGVGLLGSPCFEIPRSVERDSRFDYMRTGDEFRRRLRAKNRYDLRTMGVFVFVRWLYLFLISVIGLAAVDLYDVYAHVAIGAFFVLSLVVSALYWVLVERCFTAFRALQPRFCSIYDGYFWWHERLWKVPSVAYFQVFNGTPFKNLFWRLLGVRLGRRVFDNGCFVTERTLVAIGDDCMLNAGSKIQCHSQEDGTFKSDRITIGAGCTLGVGALVHYGVLLGEGAVLAADSFLMKGEEVPEGARWGGNPAREIRESRVQLGEAGQRLDHSAPRDQAERTETEALSAQQEQRRLRRDRRLTTAWRR